MSSLLLHITKLNFLYLVMKLIFKGFWRLLFVPNSVANRKQNNKIKFTSSSSTLCHCHFRPIYLSLYMGVYWSSLITLLFDPMAEGLGSNMEGHWFKSHNKALLVRVYMTNNKALFIGFPRLVFVPNSMVEIKDEEENTWPAMHLEYVEFMVFELVIFNKSTIWPSGLRRWI